MLEFMQTHHFQGYLSSEWRMVIELARVIYNIRSFSTLQDSLKLKFLYKKLQHLKVKRILIKLLGQLSATDQAENCFVEY